MCAVLIARMVDYQHPNLTKEERRAKMNDLFVTAYMEQRTLKYNSKRCKALPRRSVQFITMDIFKTPWIPICRFSKK